MKHPDKTSQALREPNLAKFTTTLKQHLNNREQWHVLNPFKLGRARREDLARFIQAQGHPYFYHVTTPEAAEAILRDGLYPWNAAQNSSGTRFDEDNVNNMSHLQPRPGHVYLAHQSKVPSIQSEFIPAHEFNWGKNPGKPVAATLRIDLSKLNPENINPDEDSFGFDRFAPEGVDKPEELVEHDGWAWRGEHYPSLGEWADQTGLGDNPDDVVHSIRSSGTIAHDGPIPAHAIEQVSSATFKTPEEEALGLIDQPIDLQAQSSHHDDDEGQDEFDFVASEHEVHGKANDDQRVDKHHGSVIDVEDGFEFGHVGSLADHTAKETYPQSMRRWEENRPYVPAATVHGFDNGWSVQELTRQPQVWAVGEQLKNCWRGKGDVDKAPYWYHTLNDENDVPRVAFLRQLSKDANGQPAMLVHSPEGKVGTPRKIPSVTPEEHEMLRQYASANGYHYDPREPLEDVPETIPASFGEPVPAGGTLSKTAEELVHGYEDWEPEDEAWDDNSERDPSGYGIPAAEARVHPSHLHQDENGWYLYHRAPTEDRARIMQHGLIPSTPRNNPTWQLESEGYWVKDQPTGVYMTKAEDPFIKQHDSVGSDVWKVRVHPEELEHDPVFYDDEPYNHFYSPHAVHPSRIEMHAPFEQRWDAFHPKHKWPDGPPAEASPVMPNPQQPLNEWNLAKVAGPTADELHLGLDIPDETAKTIHSWAKEQDFPEGTELEPIDDYHVTVMYAQHGRDKQDWIGSPEAHTLTIDKLDMFPSTEKPDANAYVIRLKGKDMQDYMERMLKAAEDAGLEPSRFDGPHKPHITIAYGPKIDPKDFTVPKLESFITAPAKVSEPRMSSTKTAWNERDQQPQYVPTSQLLPFMEFDRRPGSPEAIMSPERWNDLKSHIAEHGIEEPLNLDYHPETGTALLTEGNHRLQMAHELGLSHVPLKVYRSPNRLPHMMHPNAPYDNRDEFGYQQFPQPASPSYIGMDVSPWAFKPAEGGGDWYAKEKAAWELRRQEQNADTRSSAHDIVTQGKSSGIPIAGLWELPTQEVADLIENGDSGFAVTGYVNDAIDQDAWHIGMGIEPLASHSEIGKTSMPITLNTPVSSHDMTQNKLDVIAPLMLLQTSGNIDGPTDLDWPTINALDEVNETVSHDRETSRPASMGRTADDSFGISPRLDLWHFAPREHREDIEWEGLRPNDPLNMDSATGWAPKGQPTGLYAWGRQPVLQDPDTDLWRIPHWEADKLFMTGVKPDPAVRGAWVIDHPVSAELHTPAEQYVPRTPADEQRRWETGRPKWASMGLDTEDGWQVASKDEPHAPKHKIRNGASKPNDNANVKDPFRSRQSVHREESRQSNEANDEQNVQMDDGWTIHGWDLSRSDQSMGHAESGWSLTADFDETVKRLEQYHDGVNGYGQGDRAQAEEENDTGDFRIGEQWFDGADGDPLPNLQGKYPNLQDSEANLLSNPLPYSHIQARVREEGDHPSDHPSPIHSEKASLKRGGVTRTADSWDTRQWPDPLSERGNGFTPTDAHCTCEEDSLSKLTCPIHGTHGDDTGDMSWSIPQAAPVGYPQDAPRNWQQATSSVTSFTDSPVPDSHIHSFTHTVRPWYEGSPICLNDRPSKSQKMDFDIGEGSWDLGPLSGSHTSGGPSSGSFYDPATQIHKGTITPEGQVHIWPTQFFGGDWKPAHYEQGFEGKDFVIDNGKVMHEPVDCEGWGDTPEAQAMEKWLATPLNEDERRAIYEASGRQVRFPRRRGSLSSSRTAGEFSEEDFRNRDQWGIGRPDRVIGKVSDDWHLANSSHTVHYNRWTGDLCNCPWNDLHVKLTKLAGPNMNKVLKAPDKKLNTPEGDLFKSALVRHLGEERESLAPYLAHRFKKGDIRLGEPVIDPYDNEQMIRPLEFWQGGAPLDHFRDVWKRNRDAQKERAERSEVYNPDQYSRMNWSSERQKEDEDRHFNPLSDHILSNWHKWYEARQHPLRQGVDVMHGDFDPRTLDMRSQEHVKEMRREKEIEELRHSGQVVHKFPPREGGPTGGIDWDDVEQHESNGAQNMPEPPTGMTRTRLNELRRRESLRGSGALTPEEENEYQRLEREWPNIQPPRKSGWHIKQLQNREDLEAEGRMMGHCIGKDEKYANCLEHGLIDAYSLRDPRGRPHVTWHYNSDGSLAEIFGPNDDDIKPEYQDMLDEWGEQNNRPANQSQAQGHQEEDPEEDRELPELTFPAATDVGEYVSYHHPERWYETANEAEDHEGRVPGEHTEYNWEEPSWPDVAHDYANKYKRTYDAPARQEYMDRQHEDAFKEFHEAIKREGHQAEMQEALQNNLDEEYGEHGELMEPHEAHEDVHDENASRWNAAFPSWEVHLPEAHPVPVFGEPQLSEPRRPGITWPETPHLYDPASTWKIGPGGTGQQTLFSKVADHVPEYTQNVYSRTHTAMIPQGWQDMYHVSPRKNRERILAEGLRGHERGEETDEPWDYKWDQPLGNYMFDNPESAMQHVYNMKTRDHRQELPSENHVDLNENAWTYPQAPADFNDWPEEKQDEYYENEEPVVRTEDPEGYDIWKVKAHGMPIATDPETQLVTPGRKREYWDIGKIDDALNDHDIRNDIPAEADREMGEWYGNEPRRYYTPIHVPPHRLELHHHQPAWNMSMEGYEEANQEAEPHEFPQPWGGIPFTERPMPGYEDPERFGHVTANMGDLFHVAPTTERARILQHGLHPTAPVDSAEKWPWVNPEHLKTQPTGVYATPTIDEARYYGHGKPGFDTWRIPAEQIKEAYNDPELNSINAKPLYIPHPVLPTLETPAENYAWKGKEKAENLDEPPGVWTKDVPIPDHLHGQGIGVRNDARQRQLEEWGIGQPTSAKKKVDKFKTTAAQHAASKLIYGPAHPQKLLHRGAADPEWLARYIDKNGPYFYHSTGSPETRDKILDEGLLPHDQGPGSQYEHPLIPRKNHVYVRGVRTPSWPDLNVAVDLRKIDPSRLNADEDTFCEPHVLEKYGLPQAKAIIEGHDTEGFPEEYVKDEHGIVHGSWGPYADYYKLNRPEHTAHSMNTHKTIAIEGPIHPDALELPETAHMDMEQNWPHAADPAPEAKGVPIEHEPVPYNKQAAKPRTIQQLIEEWELLHGQQDWDLGSTEPQPINPNYDELTPTHELQLQNDVANFG